MKLKWPFLFAIAFLVMVSCQPKKTNPTLKEQTFKELDELNRLISKNPEDTDALHQRAKYFLASANYEDALADLNKVLQLDSKNPEFFLTLAEVYLKMGQADACSGALQQASNLDPQNPVPFFRLAELYLMMDEKPTAMIYADRSLAVQSFNPDALFVKGLVYLANTDTANAVRNFELALNQREAFFEPLFQLGVIHTVRHNPLAEQYLLKAVRLFPQQYKGRYQLALYYQENDHVKEAELQYDTLLQIVPENKFVLFNLGYLNLIYLNNLEKAIQFFDDALLSDPNYVDALYNKGRAMEELGQYSNAREVYQEVLRRETNHKLAIQALNRLDSRR
ncbi:hypothetical protein MASR2M12_04990 [Bacteroidales bacterium]